jgi:hypothetical protein
MSALHQPDLPFDEPVALLPHDGQARMIFAWRGPGGRLNRQYAAEVDDVPTIRHLLRATRDVYDCQWWMDRPLRRHAFALAGTHAYSDLDTYKVPWLAGRSLDAIATDLLHHCDETATPRPSAITCSGRGLQLKWCFDRVVGREHVGKMVALNRALTRRLSSFGGDPRATDASRLLRVTGSLHSGASRMVEVLHLEESDGKTITYDPMWLTDHLAPRADRAIADETILLPASDLGREAGRHIRRAPGRFTRESWFWAIVEDIRMLAAMRWPGRSIPEGSRDTFAFLIACQLLRIFPPREALAETLAIVSTMIEQQFLRRHLVGLCSTAMRYARDAWAGRGWVKTYRYGKTKLIEDLGVSQDEMRQMRALIDEDERQRRDRIAAARRRRAAGKAERSAWLAENNAAREKPWEVAGVSKATWYRRQAAHDA